MSRWLSRANAGKTKLTPCNPSPMRNSTIIQATFEFLPLGTRRKIHAMMVSGFAPHLQQIYELRLPEKKSQPREQIEMLLGRKT